MQNEDDWAAAFEAFARAEVEATRYLNDPEKGLLAREGKGALGLTAEGRENLAKIWGRPASDGQPEALSKFAEGLTPRQQQLFRRQTLGRYDSALNAVAAHEGRERKVYQKQVAEAAVAAGIGQAAANYTRPDMIRQSLGSITEAVRLATSGMAPEAQEQAVAAARGKLHKAVLDRMILDSPAAAKRYLDANKGDVRGDLHAGILADIRSEEKRRDVERRIREGEARARRAEAVAGARLVFEDELAAAERGETAHKGWAGQLTAAYGEKAGPMIAAVERTRELAGVAKSMATMTPAEIEATIKGRAPAGEGYEAEAKGQEALQKVAERVLAVREKDPAAAAIEAFPEIRAGLASDDDAQRTAAVRRSIEVQREVFGLDDTKVQPLTKGVASDLVERWRAAATPDEKIGAVAGVALRRGDDTIARRAIDQLEAAGLPKGVDVALERLRAGDQAQARAIVSALSVDPKDAPQLGDDTSRQVLAAVKAVYDDDNPAGVELRMSGATGDAGRLPRHLSLMQTMAKYQAGLGMPARDAADSALKAVYGDVQALNVPELAHVTVPKGTDTGVVRQGLERIRADLKLDHLAPQRDRFPNEAAYQQARLNWEREARILKEGATWIDYGDGYALAWSGDASGKGKLVLGPDGKPLRVTTTDAVLAASQATIEGIEERQIEAGRGVYTGEMP